MSLVIRVRTAARLYLLGGFVGLVYALKLTRTRSNLAHARRCLELENDLHREHVSILRHQITELAEREQQLRQESADYWRLCGAQQTEAQL